MKKFLSLVLALVMTMSLVTISAGATDFADDADVTYDEAVSVISSLGIVNGYTDGDFKPTNNLTRQAAAKIICNLILGPTTAAELHADTAPFPDVPVTNEFAGYIAYCAKEGIIGGYTDGYFRGGNPLTGYAFMKMLLGALGYDASIEGYGTSTEIVPNWSINVAKQAIGIGLNAGLVDEFNGVDQVNREEACLYAFNTLKATMVEYPENSVINVGGAQVTLSSARKDVSWGTGTKNDGNIDKDTFVQFAERYFTKLVREDGTDAFGRPTNDWTYDKKDIGSYLNYDLLVAEYTTKVEGGDVYSAVGSIAADYDLTYWVDGEKLGKDATKAQAQQIAKKNDDGMMHSGNGVLTQVFVDNDSEDTIITEINTYLAETDDYNEKKETLRLNTVWGYGYGEYDDTDVEDLELDDFASIVDYADGDMVLLTIAKGEVQSIVPAEIVEAVEIDEFSKHDYVKADGDSISYAKTGTLTDSYGYTLLSKYDTNNLDDTNFDLYLDGYGYLIGIEKNTEDDKYVFITAFEVNDKYLSNRTAKASAIFTDGTMAIIDVDLKNSDEDIVDVTTEVEGSEIVNLWFKYTVKNDSYRLNAVANQLWDGTTDKIDSKHISQQGYNWDTNNNNKFFYGNGETSYIVVSLDNVNDFAAIDDVESVTEGVKNVSINVYDKDVAAKSAGFEDAGDATFVSYGISSVYDADSAYIIASVVIGDDGSISDRYAYLYDEPTRERYNKAEDVYFWDMDAVIDGVKTTVTFKSDLPFSDTVLSKVGADGAMLKLSYDKDGYVTEAEEIDNPNDFHWLYQYSNGTVKPDDVKILKNDPATGALDLTCKNDTLWITEREQMRGYALADECPAVIIEWNEDNDEVDAAVEYTTVEKAIKALDNADKADNFDGTIYLIFKDGIVSSVVMTDTVDDVDHKNDNVDTSLTVGIVSVDTTNKVVYLDVNDKPEDGRAWTAEEMVAINTSVKAALIEAGYEATGDMTYGPDKIMAVNTNASNTQEFPFTVDWA